MASVRWPCQPPSICVPLKRPNAKEGKAALAVWKNQHQQHTPSAHAVTIIKRQRTQLDQMGLADKPLLAITDNSYVNCTVIKGLPAKTHLLGRCRKDIALYQPGVSKHRYGTKAH